MKFLLGTKEHMTQVFTEDGVAHPVTIVSAGPMVVTQVKDKEKDGYHAVQFGFGARNEKNVTKAVLGHTKAAREKAGVAGAFRFVREFRNGSEADAAVSIGDNMDVSIFAPGDLVIVSAISKGKGFQGVVKRHGFHGGPRTHGQKHSEREPGSIGAQGPQRVLKGKKMAGRMGGDRVTVKNLEVILIDPENNQLAIRGAIPGRRGTLVEIRSA